MSNSKSNNKPSDYQYGLNKEREAVISAHFMQNISDQLNLYSKDEFRQKKIDISTKSIIEELFPSLLKACDKFILERIAAAKNRIKRNFKTYGLHSYTEASVGELITEVMYDRQFLKGSKLNYSKKALLTQIKELVKEKKTIKMVVPALPYKSSSPLKSRGIMPDLAEINFLLALMEMAKTIDLIYRQELTSTNQALARFTVISDGRRFNHFLNESDENIQKYQEQLKWWIDRLQLSPYIEFLDYKVVLNLLSQEMLLEKKMIRERVRNLYSSLMEPILNPYNMMETMKKAILSDPNPETSHPEGRFIPLFKSLIYIINYPVLVNYVHLHKENYTDLYTKLTKHIFEPYTKLSTEKMQCLDAFIANPHLKEKPKSLEILEYLRQTMLHQVWQAAIEYIAEIRSDRDLYQEPITTCFPEHIRWTIHAKPGQLAILTTTAFGDPVQPWQGVGIFKLTKNNKIKLYSLPASLIEGMGGIPVMIKNNKKEYGLVNQPLFYISPEIKFADIHEFLEKLKQFLIRKRKF